MLTQAIRDWLDDPINEHGTPFVGFPESFSVEEQDEFVSLVREERFVSREEQVQKIREILARR